MWLQIRCSCSPWSRCFWRGSDLWRSIRGASNRLRRAQSEVENRLLMDAPQMSPLMPTISRVQRAGETGESPKANSSCPWCDGWLHLGSCDDRSPQPPGSERSDHHGVFVRRGSRCANRGHAAAASRRSSCCTRCDMSTPTSCRRPYCRLAATR